MDRPDSRSGIRGDTEPSYHVLSPLLSRISYQDRGNSLTSEYGRIVVRLSFGKVILQLLKEPG